VYIGLHDEFGQTEESMAKGRKRGKQSVKIHQAGISDGLHIGVKDVSPLAVLQFEDALDFLLSSVVVEKDVDTAAQVGLGLVSELLHLGEIAKVSGNELELGGRRVLLDVLCEVLDVLDFLLVVVQQQGGSLVGARWRSR